MRKYIIRWKARRGVYCQRTFRHMTPAAQCVRDVLTLFGVRPRVSIKRRPKRL